MNHGGRATEQAMDIKMRAGRLTEAKNTQQEQKNYGLKRQENYKDCELSVMKKRVKSGR